MEPSEGELRQKLNSISLKIGGISAFAWSAVLILAIALVLGFIFLNKSVSDLNTKFDSFQTALQQHPPASKQISGAGDAYETRLKSVEESLSAVSASSGKALEQMYYIFTMVASFFGLVTVFFAIRQFMADGGKERRDTEMIGLVGSFRDNVSVVNSLIITLEKSFSYKAEVTEQLKGLSNELTAVTNYKKKTEEKLQEKLDALNRRAYEIFTELDRDNFKSEEKKRVLENFYAALNSMEFGEVSASGLSPFCYYIRGLRYFNVMQYKLAGSDMEKAREVGVSEKDRAMMAGDCEYHLGIIYYNTGDYKLARERFREAFAKTPTDFRSRIYIPELMFFDKGVPFEEVVAEFKMVRAELENLPAEQKGNNTSWHANMVLLMMKYGNCYLKKLLSPEDRAIYKNHENNDTAAGIYLEAYQMIKKRNGAKPSLPETFLKFSLAQSLTSGSLALSKNIRPLELYKEVFYDVKREAVFKNEPIMLMLLNYILAICINQRESKEESPAVNLNLARDYIKQIPEGVKIYSPLNKINLSRTEILDEIDSYEQKFINTK